MRSSSIIFLCLLTTALYLSYRNTYLCSSPSSSSSSSSSIVFTGRPYMRQLSTSTSDYRNQRRKIKVVDSKKMRSNVEGRSMDGNIYYEKRDGDELIYHIDYHGVTTHPTPTPKHPKP